MRQRRWLDLLKDYNYETRYHPGKANVVADALSQKESDKVIRIHSLRMIITSDIFDRIKAAQVEALKEENWKYERNVKDLLLEKAYMSKYSIHPGAIKIYLDLKRDYWWPGSRELARTDVVLATTDKIETIRERLKEAQDRWKSYADKRTKPIEFNVGDLVMLKVSPWKGVMRFKNKRKLSPRFIWLFKILKRVGEVAYTLELPEEIRGIHNTFHMSYLRKCLADESSVITLDDVEINAVLTFQEEPVAILGRKALTNSSASLCCMCTRSSSNLPGESPPNPSSLNPKRRNRRRSKQPFILKESPVDTMTDQRTMAELLHAPTEGYAEAIAVPRFLLSNSSSSTVWDRYTDLLRACLHHDFTEFHQLDTFYNALNPTGQDSLNSAADGNLLERRTQDVLTIVKNKSKVRNSRNKSIVSQVKSSDANSSSSSEIAKLTHAVNQQTSACLVANGNTFPKLQDNIQGYIAAAAFNYNQAITTQSGIVLGGPFVPMPPPFINPEEDECAEETYGPGSR
nr:hypothetical protein [Tanacetum cinerariifolium]